jgi:hypothetical protein
VEVDLGRSCSPADREPPIPGEVVVGAMIGGFGEDAREVEELRLKWIWDPWRFDGQTLNHRRGWPALFLAFGGRRKRELRERRKESRRRVGGLNEDVQDAENGRERGEVRLWTAGAWQSRVRR